MKSKDFLAIFEEPLFFGGITASTKQDVLAAVVEQLYLQKRVNSRQAVLNTLIEREKLGSTGIGKGIAIPHSRSMMVDRLTVSFAPLAEPIAYDAIDDKPVSLLFLILAPPQDVGNQYLPFIGKLVEVVKEKTHRDALRKVTSFAAFRKVMEGAL